VSNNQIWQTRKASTPDAFFAESVVARPLDGYGVRWSDGEESYWPWSRRKPGSVAVARKLDAIRDPLGSGDPTREQLLRFYDFVAKSPFLEVIHSTKADAIRQTGEAIEARLPQQGRVLDVGCNVGHLTTWCARTSADRQVLVWTFPKRASA
jgi:hypothetical protein